jgi:hypothetical protein
MAGLVWEGRPFACVPAATAPRLPQLYRPVSSLKLDGLSAVLSGLWGEIAHSASGEIRGGIVLFLIRGPEVSCGDSEDGLALATSSAGRSVVSTGCGVGWRLATFPGLLDDVRPTCLQ